MGETKKKKKRVSTLKTPRPPQEKKPPKNFLGENNNYTLLSVKRQAL